MKVLQKASENQSAMAEAGHKNQLQILEREWEEERKKLLDQVSDAQKELAETKRTQEIELQEL